MDLKSYFTIAMYVVLIGCWITELESIASDEVTLYIQLYTIQLSM